MNNLSVPSEAVEIWGKISNNVIPDPLNWISLEFGSGGNVIVGGSGSGGLEEASLEFDKEKEKIVVVVLRICVMKWPEMFPLDVLFFSCGKDVDKIERAIACFYLEELTQKIGVRFPCYMEISTPEEVKDQNEVSKRIGEIIGSSDVTGSFHVDNTIYGMRIVNKARNYVPRLPERMKTRICSHFESRRIYGSQCFKEGGGKFSHSIKSRWHEVRGNCKVLYFDVPGGKLKGTYSIDQSRIGYGSVDRKLGSIGKILGGKSKKGKVEGEWWFIETIRRTYNICSPREVAENWLRVLECMGCRRTDLGDSDDEEEEDEGEEEASTNGETTLGNTGIQERMGSRASQMENFSKLVEGSIRISLVSSKPLDSAEHEEEEKVKKKQEELEEFSKLLEEENPSYSSMKDLIKQSKHLNVDNIVRNKRSSKALYRSMRKYSVHGRPEILQKKKKIKMSTTTTSQDDDDDTFEKKRIASSNRESFEGHVDVMKELFGLKGETDHGDGIGFSTLQYVYEQNPGYRDELINELILFSKKGVNKPLLEACQHNYMAIVKKLVECGADVNFRHKKTGDTPLICLARSMGQDPMKITKFLLEKGADPIIANKKGETFMSISKNDISKERSYSLVEKWLKKK